jgi:hypothetical protein
MLKTYVFAGDDPLASAGLQRQMSRAAYEMDAFFAHFGISRDQVISMQTAAITYRTGAKESRYVETTITVLLDLPEEKILAFADA